MPGPQRWLLNSARARQVAIGQFGLPAEPTKQMAESSRVARLDRKFVVGLSRLVASQLFGRLGRVDAARPAKRRQAPTTDGKRWSNRRQIDPIETASTFFWNTAKTAQE